MVEHSQITVSMSWLSVDDRYTQDDRPRLRPEVLNWQMELAREIKSSIATLGLVLGPQMVVDIEMFFPDDGQKRHRNDFLKSIIDAVEAGTGIASSNLIPFVRSVQHAPDAKAGFLIRVYSASFAGHGRTGTITRLPGPDGGTAIVMDDDLPADWHGTRVEINLGVIRNDEHCHA